MKSWARAAIRKAAIGAYGCAGATATGGRIKSLFPFAALHGEPAALCQSLASEGLHIQIAKQRDFADYLNGADVSGRVTRVESTGWHSIGGREVFVLPSETIGPAAAETVILEGAASAPYEVRGTLADWRAGVGGLARGHVLPTLAISAAFAGPLLYLAGGEGGGVHFFGQSSKGKTTILQAAASVWGRGASDGYVRAWRATANGLEGARGARDGYRARLGRNGRAGRARRGGGDLFAGQRRGEATGWARRRLARAEILARQHRFVGRDSLRGEIDGRRGARRAPGKCCACWTFPLIADSASACSTTAATTGDAGALARAIKSGASAAYGTAGPEFVRRIIREGVNGDDVRAMVADFVKAEVRPGADGQVERVAQRLGLIAAAGELATSLGVAPWPAG